MSETVAYPNAPDLSPADYLVLGVATCFVKEEGEVRELQVVEPIPSAALEALLKGIATSYQFAWATTLGDVVGAGVPTMPADFPEGVQFGNDFIERAIAAARTYHKKPEATQHIPVGSRYDALNYSLERKRILNGNRVVKTEDNVKQHEYTHKVL